MNGYENDKGYVEMLSFTISFLSLFIRKVSLARCSHIEIRGDRSSTKKGRKSEFNREKLYQQMDFASTFYGFRDGTYRHTHTYSTLLGVVISSSSYCSPSQEYPFNVFKKLNIYDQHACMRIIIKNYCHWIFSILVPHSLFHFLLTNA